MTSPQDIREKTFEKAESRMQMAAFNKALEKAKDFGWTHIKNDDKWEDYCPECSVGIK